MQTKLNTSTIKELVDKNYDFEMKSLIKIEEGFVGGNYQLKTEDNKKYFLKIRSSNNGKYLNSIRTLNYLNKIKFNSISELVLTLENDLFLEVGENILIIQKFIEGVSTTKYNSEKLAIVLKNLHELQISKSVRTILEDYDVSYEIKYEDSIQSIIHKYEVLKFLENSLIDLENYYTEIKTLSTTLNEKSFNNVYTHGDSHNNIISNNDQIFLVDWDSVMLAPRERDLFLYLNNKKFMDAYGLQESELNPELIRFYRLERLFNDINGFVEKITETDDQKIQEKYAKMLYHSTYGWLFPLLENEQ